MADEEDYIDEDDIVMVDSEDDVEDLDDDEVDDDEEDMNDDSDGDIDGSTSAAAAPVQEEDSAVARRRAIQGIMRDNTLSDQEKRMRIQKPHEWRPHTSYPRSIPNDATTRTEKVYSL